MDSLLTDLLNIEPAAKWTSKKMGYQSTVRDNVPTMKSFENTRKRLENAERRARFSVNKL